MNALQRNDMAADAILANDRMREANDASSELGNSVMEC